jgi:predicted flavoprotein YhiN
MLFTHFGISGPATFALSSHMALEKISSSDTLTVGISLDATRDFQTWDTLIRTACEKESTKQVKTIL